MFLRKHTLWACLLIVSASLASATYTVKENDTLGGIAIRHGVSLDSLLKSNPGLNADKLSIGQKLTIPSTSSSKQKVASKTSESGYLVRKGDTDERIAKKLGVNVEKLRESNPGVNWRKMQIGDRLVIPGWGKVTKVASVKRGLAKHKVKDGENDWLIAKKYNIGLDELYALNGNVSFHPLRADVVLLVPGKAESKTVLRHRKQKAVTVAKASKKKDSKKQTVVVASKGKSIGEVALLKTAKSFLGTPYRYGASSRSSTDCSGFVSQVFRAHGVHLPRTSASQATVGRVVQKSDLQKCDLVFFRTRGGRRISHVGIYIGGGKFIHASSSGGKVEIDSLSSGYYSKRFAGARRVTSSVTIAKLDEEMESIETQPSEESVEEPEVTEAPSRIAPGFDDLTQ